MTDREKQIAEIREACVKANPAIESQADSAIDIIDPYCNMDGVETDEFFEKQFNVVRLADVLLVLNQANFVYAGSGEFANHGWKAKSIPTGIFWNLKNDDLELQSDETITFIHNLLKK